MLDKWFIEDVKKGLDKTNRFVIIDGQNKCQFLLERLKSKRFATIFEVHTEIDELKIKYEIEKSYIDKKVIIFTTRKLDDLIFIREYCETGGCLTINFLHRYIAEKVKQKMRFDLVSQPEKIVAFGKLSVGRKKDFWDNVRINGDIFPAEDILGFLKSPETKFQSWDKEAQKLLTDLLSEHTQFPLENKPPQTIADEITKALFDHIISGSENDFFDNLYRKWVDSREFEPALKRYVKKYQLPDGINVWKIPTYHPFKDMDYQWLKEFSEHVNDRGWIS